MLHALIKATLTTALALVPTLSAAQSVTLDVTYSSGSYTEIMEETAARFAAAHPGVTIDLRAPYERHEAHLQATLRDAALGTPADVAFHGNHLVRIVVERGIAQPIDDFVGEAGFEALGYDPAVPGVARYDGQTFGLPWQISVPIIFYNADLVARAGGDPANLPTDWDGVLDLAEAINGLGDHITGGHFAYDTNGNCTFQSLINSHGGTMMNDGETELTFTGADGVWALGVMRDFAERGGMIDMSGNQAQQLFEGGNLGILASFSSLLGRFERAAAGNFDLVTGRWPIPAADGTVPAGGRTIVIQTEEDAKQQAAWDYLTFMTGPEVQSLLVERIGGVPANSRVIESGDYLAQYYAERPAARTGTKMIPRLSGWYAFPGENPVRIVDTIKEGLRQVITLEAEPDAVAAALAGKVTPMLGTAR
ncbi:MAG: extracellular solute-binding protein [Pseudomonadota bacterium]